MGTVVAVNVVHTLRPDTFNGAGLTAIDKRPVTGRVLIGPNGVRGDRSMDVVDHGGRDKAVYAYASEDLQWWAQQLGRELVPGQFGENLTTTGLDMTGALVGERWRLGGAAGAVVEVTMPRTPCVTFATWLGEPRWVRRFTDHGAPGAYLRVLEPGLVAAGDAVEVVHRPSHGVSIGDCFGQVDPAKARRLLEAADAGEVDLAPDLRPYTETAAARV